MSQAMTLPVEDRDLALARPVFDAIAARFDGGPNHVMVDCDPALMLPPDVLEPLRVVAFEAVDNAIRHAFPNHIEGKVWIRLFHDRGRLTLTIRDNGVGMPDFPDYGTGGRARIFEAAKQLRAYARLGAAPFGGALVSIVCPA